MSRSARSVSAEGPDPLMWSNLGLSAESIQELHGCLVRELERYVDVNSLLVTVGLRLPTRRLDRARAADVSPLWQETAGVLVSDEWMDFLVDGNYLDDPMTKRLGRASRPLFWWEDSPLHRSMDREERQFARLYMEHEIRFGIVEACVDRHSMTADMIAFDCAATFREFRDFERVYGGRLKLAMAWLSEAIKLKSLVASGCSWPLTRRQHECLAWTSTGLSSAEIGDRLHLSEATVGEHLTAAMRRLGAQTRTQACARATLLGLMQP